LAGRDFHPRGCFGDFVDSFDPQRIVSPPQASPGALNSLCAEAMSDKIGPQHLARRAIVYVRQSSVQQLANNEESRRLQYAMRDRLGALGWHEVEVIDEDLGKSAAGSVDRSGFRRLVAEVSLGLVGVVAARELSRFARNSRDWQQLVAICRVVDTLLIDHEAVYAPRSSNDRLLLGLKGSLNEYELDLLRLRGLEARKEKASRGELLAGVPIGYCVDDDGRLEKTPDLRVRQMVELIFTKFFELGSARQVTLWLLASDTKVASTRDRRGGVEWRAATPDYVTRMLRNPTYAGAYAYGRTRQYSRVVDGQLRTSTKRVPRSEWPVLLNDRHEAYISWQQFERVEQMLTKNSQSRGSGGAAGRGNALFAGLIFCRRCGCRMGVSYGGNTLYGRYRCDAAHQRRGAPKCISFSALDVDKHLARQLITVVQPGAIEAARIAWEHDAAGHDRALEALELEAEQARFQASRAERQYNAVDPDNRTVARELERRWNAALEFEASLQQRVADARAMCAATAAAKPDMAQYLSLARNLEHVWSADTTDTSLKKRIARSVIEQVWADIDDDRREIALVVHYKGGAHCELRVRKRHTGERSGKTAPEVVEAVRALARIMPDQQIALWLGRAGMRTPSEAHYTRALVASVRHLRGIEAYSEQRQRKGGRLTSEQAAELLGVHSKTVRRAAARNELKALRPLPNGPWIFTRHDIIAAAAARQVAAQTDRRRRLGHADPSSEQLDLKIPNT
jgi:excisionase family DNA binding protein